MHNPKRKISVLRTLGNTDRNGHQKTLRSEKVIGPQMSITRLDYNKLQYIFVIHIVQVK